MKYLVLKNKDGKIQKVIHINDAEKLILQGKAEWVVDRNGIRCVRLKDE